MCLSEVPFILKLVVFPLLVFVSVSYCIYCSWYVWYPKYDSVLLSRCASEFLEGRGLNVSKIGANL